MKIVYISDSILPSKTANSVHVMNMCHSFAKLGHEVIFLAVSSHSLTIKGIDNLFNFYGVEENFKLEILPVKNVKNKILNVIYREIFINPWLKKKLKKINPDFVYGRQVVGCHLAAKMKIPTAFEAHAPMWEIGPVVNYYLTKLIKHKQFLLFTAISKALIKIYQERAYHLPNIMHLPDASVEIPDFKQRPVLSQNSDNLKIVYTGHLYKGRGIEIIISLAEKLSKHDFYIIGGHENDVKYWKSKNTLSNLHFIGYVPPGEVYKYRNAADILLAPYQKKVFVFGKHETSSFMSPLKIFEYMASNKAIICSDLPVLREVLNAENSILVPPDDVNAWEKAINLLDSDRKLMSKLAQKAYDEFIENYTWDKRAQKVLANISEIIHS